MKNDLKKYNTKRNFNKTKEPKGEISKNKNAKLKFVVQHHLARKDHYDLRLEWHGVMKSWAVPKGPSYNPKDKRLAIMVEDHPLSYRHFEGCIPKGEYGGGTVMVWDGGTWTPHTEIPSNFKTNMFKFTLNGSRLKGKWTLVKLDDDDNWLLIKEKDNFDEYKDIKKLKTSIKSGRTMEEIAERKKKTTTSLKKGIVDNIEITNPDKIIFKKEKITKLDIALYYHKVSERMLPFLEKRIISTIRCPEGNLKEIFFKKHLENQNKGLGQIILENDSGNKEDYYYIKNKEGLISEVQMNSYEFHIWGSQINHLEKPDIMVFDLDPDEKLNIKKLREGVKDLKSILDNLNLKSYLKTSGGKGYHILVPIKNKMNWEEFRQTAKNIALLMEKTWPDKYTSNIRKNKRKGKIFIDWVRNTRSSTSVAPYSLRLREGCPISMPIKWSELDKVKPNEITLKEAIKRLKRKNPWEDFFD